ncbi:hypothetical protein SAMN05216428_101126 [Nitrosospira sp. Nsp11]|nr:hypothetical protein SAMN05216428_101126 [Nitrosospira sp. Nsp11]
MPELLRLLILAGEGARLSVITTTVEAAGSQNFHFAHLRHTPT